LATGKATIRESYLSMFGVSSQTEFRSLLPSDLDETAAFVVGEATKLVDYVRNGV